LLPFCYQTSVVCSAQNLSTDYLSTLPLQLQKNNAIINPLLKKSNYNDNGVTSNALLPNPDYNIN